MAGKIFQDHLGRTVQFDHPPKRIVSLCPSITETLFALNLSSEIAGRTRYCIHPADRVEQAVIVGGTKQIKHEAIDQLNPDLIIAEKEENPKEMVELLADRYPVYVTDVENYDDALKMIRDLGSITGREQSAAEMAVQIDQQFRRVKKLNQCKVAYVIWKKPYMAAGNETFIHSILEKCGFTNVFKDYSGRYPMVTLEDFKAACPDFIFLSSEPFPFKEKDKREFEQHFTGIKTLLVDGEMFSWYGSRMLKAAGYLNHLIEELEESV